MTILNSGQGMSTLKIRTDGTIGMASLNQVRKHGNSEKKVQDQITEYFYLGRAKSDVKLPIEHAHHVGKGSPGRDRPVVVCFTRRKDKEEV